MLFYLIFWTWLADDLSANEQLVGPHASGVNSILPKEHGSQFFYLPIIKHSDDEVIYSQGFLKGLQISTQILWIYLPVKPL